MAEMEAMLPAALLAVFSFWCGTLPGAATAAGAATGQGLLLAAAAATGRAWSDPWRLGRRGRWLLALLVGAVGVSWLASPVPRAGRIALLLLPGWLWLPAVLCRAWRRPGAAERGAMAVAGVVAAAAAWGLADRFAGGSPRAAMPLGHHNLLAGWLLTLLPLSLLAARRRGAGRVLALAAGVLGAAALLATESLLAAAAAAAQAALAGLVVSLGIVASSQAPRLLALVHGTDPSTAARAAYLAAGLRGVAARPLAGWGPGSVAWTVGGILEPRAGVNPAGEVVGDLHSLPLALAYQLGVPGVLLAIGAAVAFSRCRAREPLRDRGLALAGRLGLAGAGVMALGNDAVAVPALPLAAAVAAAAALAATMRPEPAHRPTAPALAFAFGGAALLVEPGLAGFAYDAARRAEGPAAAREWLRVAAHRDPDFPLYTLRLALLEEDPSAAAARARAAAEGTPGVAATWLVAGRLGAIAGRPWAAAALARACWLDPLGAVAPFSLAESGLGDVPAAARAIAAEPRLAAARLWDERPEERAAALAYLADSAAVDPDWRSRLAAATAAAPQGPGTAAADLVLGFDAEPALSLSLHAFRRAAWPAELARIPLHADAIGALCLPPATAAAATRPDLLRELGCGPRPPPLP